MCFTEQFLVVCSCKSFILHILVYIIKGGVIGGAGGLVPPPPPIIWRTELPKRLSRHTFKFFNSNIPQCIDVFHKWRLWHGNEARILFSQSLLVSNYQTDMFLCFIFAKITK